MLNFSFKANPLIQTNGLAAPLQVLKLPPIGLATPRSIALGLDDIARTVDHPPADDQQF